MVTGGQDAVAGWIEKTMKLGSTFWFPRFTLVQHLLILSLTVLLPQVLLGSLIAWRYTSEQKMSLEREVTVIVRERVASLDRELEGIVGALQALATSPLIEQNDYGRFREQAIHLLSFRGTAIVMRDSAGRHIINTLQPAAAAPLQSTDADLLANDAVIFHTKAPAISNLYIGASTGRPFVNVGVPVIRDNEVRFVLAMAIDPVTLSDSLLRQTPKGWTGAIIDRKMLIIARSVAQERYVGQPASQPTTERLVGESGSFHGGATLEGAPVFSAYQTSALAGWTIVFAIPEKMLNAPLRDLWRTLLLMGLSAIALSLLGAFLYGGILRRSLGMLAHSARHVGRANFVAGGRTAVIEMDEVGRLLDMADADLKRKDAHQRTLLHELDHRVKNTLAIIQSLVTQSVRGSASPEHFREAIIGRVMALARSHEVLSAANWNEPELSAVARAILARESERVAFEGDRLSLEPRVVVAFAQIFHELLVNAEKHGSLSSPAGRVTLTCRLEGTSIQIRWIETSSEPPPVAAIKGLGTTIVRICIERQLGGVCHFEAAPEGLRFEATIPLRSELGLNATAMEQTPARKSEGGRTLEAAPTSASQTGAQTFIALD